MPLPKPSGDETHDDWMNRCMGSDVMQDEYPDDDQRLAVCESIWSKEQKMSRDKVERRVFAADDAELRVTNDDEPQIVGYAARFGKWSEDLGGFREKIKAGAFDSVVGDDVRCLRNHNPDLLLGRTAAGTLVINANAKGLKFLNTPPNTVTGRETMESIRRGDITGCSFSFRVAKDEWHEDKAGRVERTILEFERLFDVGPVTYPAYPDTSVATRSLEAWKAKREASPPDELAAEERGEEPPVEEPPTEEVAEAPEAPEEAPAMEEHANEPTSPAEIIAAAEAAEKARARAAVDKQLGL